MWWSQLCFFPSSQRTGHLKGLTGLAMIPVATFLPPPFPLLHILHPFQNTPADTPLHDLSTFDPTDPNCGKSRHTIKEHGSNPPHHDDNTNLQAGYQDNL